MTSILKAFDGEIPVVEMKIGITLVGDGVMASLNVVDEEESVIAAFTAISPIFEMDGMSALVKNLTDQWVAWVKDNGFELVIEENPDPEIAIEVQT